MTKRDKEILLISVIVPVYNCEKYIRRCVNSILNQTYTDIELLLVNDGSTDKSGSICDDFAKKSDRTIVFHTSNLGVSSARNTGLNNCTGKFVFFVDADDYIEPDAIQALVEGYAQSNSEIIIGGFNKVINDGKKVSQVEHFAGNTLLKTEGLVDYTIKYLRNPRKKQLLMSCWAKLFNVSIIKKFDIAFNTELKIAEDVAFNFSYLKYVSTAYFISKVVYNHQKSANYNSLSMKLSEDFKDLFGYIDALTTIETFLLYKNPALEIRRDIGQCYIYQTALFMVRLCGQINRENRKQVYRFVKGLINDPVFVVNIKSYVPQKGNYRLIPFLMKYKRTWLLIFFCWKEARRIYN